MLFEIKDIVSKRHFNDYITNDNYSKKSIKTNVLFSKDDARIITSGKVYRQLFESEVQLINALKKVKYTISKNSSSKINLCNSRKDNTHSINGNFDNTSDFVVGKEVSILPEDLLPTKTQSQLINKLIKSRKLKFNKEFEELQQLIGTINKGINTMISNTCEENFNEITSKRKEMENYFKIFGDSLNLTWEKFKEAEIRTNDHFNDQRAFIELLYIKLIDLEESRVKTVLQEMSNTSKKLERIGHFAPSDVHRIMNNILIDANDSILRNKEIYSDLRTKLMLATIDENRKRQIFLKNTIVIWRETTCDIYFEDFKNKIQKEELNSLESIKSELVDFDDIIIRLSARIQEVFQSIINDFNPEHFNVSYLDDINDRLLYVISEFDQQSDKFIKAIYRKVEQLNQEYLMMMNDIKVLLLQMHIFESEEDCIKVVECFCWPFLGSLQKSFEKYLDSFEIIVEETSKKLQSQSRKLFTYLSSLLMLWNDHIVALNKSEEVMFQKLNSSRDGHQQQNFLAENNLNLIIDKMRQESSDHGLKDCLSKCLNQLDKIKTSYSHFYNQQIQLIKRYPVSSDGEVKIFKEKLTSYFTNDQSVEINLEEYNEDEKVKKEKSENIDETFSLNFMPLEISNEKLLFLKEKIKNCYSDFLKQWFKSISTNTNKIVLTKVEELDSELKLRFHLHEPRYQRIEYDIHNVRSAELVIHSERVLRQCKVIDNSLENIKKEYIKLDEIQKLKQEEFKERLIADEVLYMNVTNHYKLMNMKLMLEERNEEYMNNLRSSLRLFRQTIETNLQQLRQSNAEFVRSFKLFSAGGNFCPGEIDDFNKKIETVNLKVEDTESEIMSNLEMVEKNHQDNLIILKGTFEEKFKYHIVDINFMETIKRATSNLQLKIKTEVSNSNSQSQYICEKIKLLNQNFNELQRKGTCKDDFIDKSILSNILGIFGSINDRSIYLDCIKTQGNPSKKLNVSEGNDKNNLNVKVQFSPLTTISKVGRQPNEDAGIKSVKSLLKSQKEFLVKKNIESVNGSNISESQINEIENCGRTSSPSTNSELTSNRKSNTEKSKLVNKNQRLDKRYQAFGEEELENCFTFMKKITFYCRDILDGILYTSELYYRNKGVRKVTQPSLQDNFDQAAEDIILKFKYYLKQAKDYHDECLYEFNNQLIELEGVLCNFPCIVYNNVLEKIVADCNNEINIKNKKQLDEFQKLSHTKKIYYNKLRPELSQGSKAKELQDLISLQESLYKEELSLIDNQFQSDKKVVFSTGKIFIEVVTNVTEQLLLLLDNLLTTNDINNLEPKLRFINAKELVRKHNTALSEENAKYEDIFTSTKKTWTFNDLDDMLYANDSVKTTENSSSVKCLITSKYTSCHIRSFRERETCIKQFKSFYFKLLTKVEDNKMKGNEESNNYKLFWDESVKKLKEMNNP